MESSSSASSAWSLPSLNIRLGKQKKAQPIPPVAVTAGTRPVGILEERAEEAPGAQSLAECLPISHFVYKHNDENAIDSTLPLKEVMTKTP